MPNGASGKIPRALGLLAAASAIPELSADEDTRRYSVLRFFLKKRVGTHGRRGTK
jgi:hypothetical protein